MLVNRYPLFHKSRRPVEQVVRLNKINSLYPFYHLRQLLNRKFAEQVFTRMLYRLAAVHIIVHTILHPRDIVLNYHQHPRPSTIHFRQRIHLQQLSTKRHHRLPYRQVCILKLIPKHHISLSRNLRRRLNRLLSRNNHLKAASHRIHHRLNHSNNSRIHRPRLRLLKVSLLFIHSRYVFPQ